MNSKNYQWKAVNDPIDTISYNRSHDTNLATNCNTNTKDSIDQEEIKRIERIRKAKQKQQEVCERLKRKRSPSKELELTSTSPKIVDAVTEVTSSIFAEDDAGMTIFV